MSGHDEFRSWRWDREDKAANRQALVIHRHGHRIVCDHHGLLIDGQRIDTKPVYDPSPLENGDKPEPALDLADNGRLVYRGRAVALLHPREDGTANPGRLELLTAASSPRHSTPRRSTAA
ncbi:hypothetical protein AB0903_28230 [Streptomyces sp. NPDC048389]|uniref:hypothetical protein n=1 Tax=Streptomyces sp. NPDC048389 TaxID=3154622 RepID=UPI0034554E62